jgi:hypothetical protein
LYSFARRQSSVLTSSPISNSLHANDLPPRASSASCCLPATAALPCVEARCHRYPPASRLVRRIADPQIHHALRFSLAHWLFLRPARREIAQREQRRTELDRADSFTAFNEELRLRWRHPQRATLRALVDRCEAALVEPLREQAVPCTVEKQQLCPLAIATDEKKEVPAEHVAPKPHDERGQRVEALSHSSALGAGGSRSPWKAISRTPARSAVRAAALEVKTKDFSNLAHGQSPHGTRPSPSRASAARADLDRNCRSNAFGILIGYFRNAVRITPEHAVGAADLRHHRRSVP